MGLLKGDIPKICFPHDGKIPGLVNVYIAMENLYFFWVNPRTKWLTGWYIVSTLDQYPPSLFNWGGIF